jgi:hypothetical protein
MDRRLYVVLPICSFSLLLVNVLDLIYPTEMQKLRIARKYFVSMQRRCRNCASPGNILSLCNGDAESAHRQEIFCLYATEMQKMRIFPKYFVFNLCRRMEGVA